eukprot:8812180-Pyramimonas_sp.AAC.1
MSAATHVETSKVAQYSCGHRSFEHSTVVPDSIYDLLHHASPHHSCNPGGLCGAPTAPVEITRRNKSYSEVRASLVISCSAAGPPC